MKIKSTKRALIASALALLLCASMLIGTTFAWFTDSVESGINTIQSGNLDVELYYTDSADVAKDPDSKEWKKVDANTNVFGYNNWEPGFTKVVYFKVENEGSLALKYQLSADVDSEKAGINKDGKEFLLSDYIYTKVVDTDATRDAILASTDGVKIKGSIPMNNAGNLEKGESDVIGFAIWMPTDVGNVANHNGTEEGTPQITFGINLIATQLMSENDSFGPDYDEDAWADGMKVYTAADLTSAVCTGGKVVLMNDITLEKSIEIPAGVTTQLNLDGKTITAGEDGYVIENVNGSTITIDDTNGNGKIIGVVCTGEDSTTTIENGTFNATNGGKYVFLNYKGTLTINDAVVNGGSSYPIYAYGDGFELNVNDADVNGIFGCISAYNSGNITVNGGNFTMTGVQGKTSHIVYVYGDTTMTINGGNFKHVGNISMVASGGGGIGTSDNAVLTINGGYFEGDYIDLYVWNFDAADTSKIIVRGGTYAHNPTAEYAKLDTGFIKMANEDGTYTVIPEMDEVTLTNVAGYPALYTDGTNYYVYSATALKSANELLCSNSGRYTLAFNRSYYIMSDIDASGVVWNSAWLEGSSGKETGMIFEGNGNVISNLTINGSMFNGASYDAVIRNITFDNASVISTGYHVAVVWGQVYGSLTLDNVNIKNSSITGKCNVAALVGAIAVEDATVTYNDCSVENTTIAATGEFSGVEGDWASDPNGASVYMGRAYGASKLVFTNCTSINNTVVDNATLVDGGIYGYTTLANGWWAGTGSCDDFTNWNGISVVAEGTTITDAINSGASEVFLPEGEYKMPSVSGSKEFHISGTKDTVIDITLGAYMDSSKVSFEGVTIKGSTGKANGNGSDYAALYTPNVTYTNCTFDGPFRIGRDGATFINCTFNNLGNDYVWAYGNDATFIGCTFNSDGKALLIYSDGGNEVSKVVVENCIFNATAGAKAGAISNQNCAAIEIQNYGNGVDLTLSGNTIDSDFSGEWRIKTYHTGNPDVIVNGVEYTQTALDGKLMTVTGSAAKFDD